jgi:hypothetical protein
MNEPFPPAACVPPTPIPPAQDLSVYIWRDPRTPPPVATAPEQPAPPNPTSLLPYDLANLQTRARLSRMGHVIACGGWSAEL